MSGDPHQFWDAVSGLPTSPPESDDSTPAPLDSQEHSA